ncbi:MAG: hypothetical protein HYZ57_15470 [Acidobacteria bacterium]|nr:hypothetical protein [Acidobacteriota bacterium]MBI3281233.1 hypothetical protein [Acidobacteriota bacterium]
MSRQSLVAGLIGLVVVGGIVAFVLSYTRKYHIEVKGEVLKVRTYAVEPGETVAIVDFRIANPSVLELKIRDVQVFLDTRDGKTIDSAVFSERDAQRLFTYYPVLGQKYNPTLILRDKIAPGQTLDRMIAVKFSVPEQEVAKRKTVRVVIEEVEGPKSTIEEKRTAGP